MTNFGEKSWKKSKNIAFFLKNKLNNYWPSFEFLRGSNRFVPHCFICTIRQYSPPVALFEPLIRPRKNSPKIRLQPFRRQMKHFLTDMSNRVEHQKQNQPAIEKWPFGFVFGVQLGLRQTRALIKSYKNKLLQVEQLWDKWGAFTAESTLPESTLQ